jgi:hypothetical protein
METRSGPNNGTAISAKAASAHEFRVVVYHFVNGVRFEARRLRLARRTERTQDEAETGGNLGVAG